MNSMSSFMQHKERKGKRERESERKQEKLRHGDKQTKFNPGQRKET